MLPPTSHWRCAPLPLAGGDIWHPASPIQVCRGEMDRNAPLGEGLAFLRPMPAHSASPVPVQDRRTVTPGAAEVSQQMLLGARARAGLGCAGASFHLGRCRGRRTFTPPARKGLLLSGGTQGIWGPCVGHRFGKCFQGRRKKLGSKCGVWKVVVSWEGELRRKEGGEVRDRPEAGGRRERNLRAPEMEPREFVCFSPDSLALGRFS